MCCPCGLYHAEMLAFFLHLVVLHCWHLHGCGLRAFSSDTSLKLTLSHGAAVHDGVLLELANDADDLHRAAHL